MANLVKLREKEAEEFITKTLRGLKAIRREIRSTIAELKELEGVTKGGGSDEKDS